jgi:hypothetical protein
LKIFSKTIDKRIEKKYNGFTYILGGFMKKVFFVFIPIIAFIMLCINGMQAVAQSFQVDPLDSAIREASTYLNGNISKGTKVVFLNISSDYPDLSEYIISLLSENAVNDRIFSVVDRGLIDSIREELSFQMSGDVDDNSAQSIGKMLGAQSIVSGAVSKIGTLYRLQVKAIEVQTAEIGGQWSKNFPSGSPTITALTQRYAPQGSTPVVELTTPSSGQAAIPAKPLILTNGTYTFFPRIQAWRGARNINVYLDRVVVRNGFITFHITNVAAGRGSNTDDFYCSETTLQDLDRPSMEYRMVEADNESGGEYCTFQVSQGTRFKLYDSHTPSTVFEEIVLKNPDQ